MRTLIVVFFFFMTCDLIADCSFLNESNLAIPVQEDESMATVVTAFPEDKQLFARNIATNLAEVKVQGSTSFTNLQHVELRIFRENVLVQSLQSPLVFINGNASFLMLYDLLAERANYKFELYSFDGMSHALIQSADEVVAGDVYIIDGQSNAEAKMWNGSAAAYIDPFVRVFGRGVPTLPQVWHIGQGDGDRNSDGNTGQWGLVLANKMSATTNIPIAIFNGAHGGTAISFHARNDADPTDQNTNYGRLLQRLKLTGLDTAVRAIMWYQGESDGQNTQAFYETSFDALYQDWKIDFPNSEQFYTIQVRSGCGGNASQMINIQEALRKQSSLKADMKLMTTKGIITDGCHYAFVDGYDQLGLRMANLLLNDFYGASNPDAEAPDIVTAMIMQNDPFKIELTLTGVDALFIDTNVATDFIVPGNSVLSVSVSGNNLITLQLALAQVNAMTITYLDSSPTTATPYIKDSVGIGLASFKDFDVTEPVSSEDCIPIRIVSNNVPNGLYRASVEIISTGQVYGENVIFEAGNNILLDTGFEARPNPAINNAFFLADIKDCSQ